MGAPLSIHHLFHRIIMTVVLKMLIAWRIIVHIALKNDKGGRFSAYLRVDVKL